MNTEECMTAVVHGYYMGLEQLGMSVEDVKWFQCRPDEVRYPIQLDGIVAWGFNLVFRFKNNERAVKQLEMLSPTCPISDWIDYSDALYHEELKTLKGWHHKS